MLSAVTASILLESANRALSALNKSPPVGVMRLFAPLKMFPSSSKAAARVFQLESFMLLRKLSLIFALMSARGASTTAAFGGGAFVVLGIEAARDAHGTDDGILTCLFAFISPSNGLRANSTSKLRNCASFKPASESLTLGPMPACKAPSSFAPPPFIMGFGVSSASRPQATIISVSKHSTPNSSTVELAQFKAPTTTFGALEFPVFSRRRDMMIRGPKASENASKLSLARVPSLKQLSFSPRTSSAAATCLYSKQG